MAAPTSRKTGFFAAEIDYTTDRIDILLLDDSTAFTFDPATHATVGDVLNDASEMSGTGYERKTLTNQTTYQDDSNDEGEWSADDLTWTELDAGTIQSIVLFHENADGSGDSTNPVVTVFDDDSATTVSDLPLVTNGSDVTISWSSDGIMKIIG